MRLEQRPDPRQLGGVAFDDRVRVADVDRREADAVDLLGLADDDLAEVLLDEAAARSMRACTSRGPTRTVTSSAPVRSASQRAAMRVPLPDISAREPSGFQIAISSQSSPRPEDLEDAVGVAHRRHGRRPASAARRQ